MAVRLGVDPFMFMQKSYIVHGKPGMEAQLAIALINSSGLFTDPLAFEINGDDPENPFDESYMVRAWAVRKSTKQRVNGPWVDWKMVRAEGWFDKPGSKWKTIPSLMFCYRAASFFGRLACPERMMGMSTIEELQDLDSRVAGVVPAVQAATLSRIDSLAAAREAADPEPTAIEATATASTPAPTKPATTTPATNGHRSTGRPGPKRQAEQPADESGETKQAGGVAGSTGTVPAAAPSADIDPAPVEEPTEDAKARIRASEFLDELDPAGIMRYVESIPQDIKTEAKAIANVTIIKTPAHYRAVAFNAHILQQQERKV
jgi:hypothetical protein